MPVFRTAFIKLLTQPLLHFCLAGALVYLWYSHVAETAQADTANTGGRIVVKQETLLNFLQYRTQRFDEGSSRQRLSAMSKVELRNLADLYVEEEVLYRAALARGLDDNDYVIRQRLAESMSYLLESEAAAKLEVSGAVLEQWFASHQEDYRIAAAYDFSHIWFDSRRRGHEQAVADAQALLDSGRLSVLDADQVVALGDRYPFLQHYEDRTRDFVINNFSEEFVSALNTMPENAEAWQGPINSPYGAHLVLLRAREASRLPGLDEVRGRVADDYLFNQVHESRLRAVDALIQQYEVSYELD